MATFTYKAITKRGLVVKNRVEAPTKQQLINSLKHNDLIPIDIVKIPYGGQKRKTKQKKNISNVEDMMKNLNIGIVIVAISLTLASCGNSSEAERNQSAA